MKKLRFDKNTPLARLNTLPKVGGHYHVSWAYSHGVVGVCGSINEIDKTVLLFSPKTKRPFKNPVKWDDLRLTRKAQIKQLRNKL